MVHIVTLGRTFTRDQLERLKKFGSVVREESPASVDAFVAKSENADVIYSDGAHLLEALPRLKNVFVTYPFVELGVFDSEELAKNNVFVANAQGGNRNSIAEWTMFMVLSLFRNFLPYVRTATPKEFELNESLEDKKVLIVGHGSIGSRIDVLCTTFGMDVSFFERGDDITTRSADVDVVINALNCNTSSNNFLDKSFFMNVKKGSYYITFARPFTYDIDGLVDSIDAGIVAGAAIDCDPEKFGDVSNEFYMKAMSNEKILVTPHIAFSTTRAVHNGSEIAIQNIEAFLSGNSQNILKKV